MSFVELVLSAVMTTAVVPAAGVPAEVDAAPLLIGLVESADGADDAVATGAEAALRRVNATGGIDGRPLRLVRLAAARPWRDGASRIAEMVFRSDLAALIGSTDGATAHVAAQIATRKRIPLLVLSSEGSLTRVNDPWIFRGVPDDAQQARALLRQAIGAKPAHSALIAVPGGRTGRERAAALVSVSDELGIDVAAVVEPGRTDLSVLPRADLLLLWLEPEGAFDLLRELERQGKIPRRVLGSVRLDVAGLPDSVPRGVETFMLPRLVQASGPDVAAMELRARLGHDMVQALVAASRRGGTTPGELRDGLLDVEAVAGWSGEFAFDGSGNRVGEIPIGIVKGGTLQPPSEACHE